jgi:nucleoside-diphosphate-sugar epimerase
MHILVTGAAGIVGQTVVAGLRAHGHAVRAHDLRPAVAVLAGVEAMVGAPAPPFKNWGRVVVARTEAV